MTALHLRNCSSETGPNDERKGLGSWFCDWSSLRRRFVAGGDGVRDIRISNTGVSETVLIMVVAAALNGCSDKSRPAILLLSSYEVNYDRVHLRGRWPIVLALKLPIRQPAPESPSLQNRGSYYV